jgi:hypothetical protein
MASAEFLLKLSGRFWCQSDVGVALKKVRDICVASFSRPVFMLELLSYYGDGGAFIGIFGIGIQWLAPYISRLIFEKRHFPNMRLGNVISSSATA